MEKGVVGYLVKYGYLVGISRYRNAGSPPVRRGKDGVGGKGDYDRLHGYLDAKSRHSKVRMR